MTCMEGCKKAFMWISNIILETGKAACRETGLLFLIENGLCAIVARSWGMGERITGANARQRCGMRW